MRWQAGVHNFHRLRFVCNLQVARANVWKPPVSMRDAEDAELDPLRVGEMVRGGLVQNCVRGIGHSQFALPFVNALVNCSGLN